MKRFLCMIAALAVTAPAFAGVSVSVGEPGFYGRIDVGGLPPPRLIYSQPIVVEREPVGVVREPIYLRVPPGHAKHWREHCAQYNACGERVYFVQDAWYSDVYVPRYQRRAYRVEPAPAYAYAEPPRERLYTVPVASVHAVVGAPEQRCWVERRQVVQDRGDVNVPGAIVGAVIGGVLGHQVGGGRGRRCGHRRQCRPRRRGVRPGRATLQDGAKRRASGILGRDVQLPRRAAPGADERASRAHAHGGRERRAARLIRPASNADR